VYDTKKYPRKTTTASFSFGTVKDRPRHSANAGVRNSLKTQDVGLHRNDAVGYPHRCGGYFRSKGFRPSAKPIRDRRSLPHMTPPMGRGFLQRTMAAMAIKVESVTLHGNQTRTEG